MSRLTFQQLDLKGSATGTPMAVTYAPTELAFSKSATFAEVGIPGLDQPLLQFVRGDTETLSMELFFDSTGNGTGKGAVAVTAEVEAFHALVTVNGKLHMPPLVRVSWGQDFPGTSMGPGGKVENYFTAVVLSVGRRFTLFNPDGKPLRAVVSIALKRFVTMADQIKAINYQSADHTRLHIVAEGETLPLIAFDAYGDAGSWRVIAEHNQLTEVRDVVPGTRLELPPLVLR